MKSLRDLLIIIVLGGIVIGFADYFYESVKTADVRSNPIVRHAENECILDEVICHAGQDQFASVADAESYLNSALHLEAVKKRDADAKNQQELNERLNSHGKAKK